MNYNWEALQEARNQGLVLSQADMVMLLRSDEYHVTDDGRVFGPYGELKLSPDSQGYIVISMSCKIGDKRVVTPVYVHRLQAYQKFGLKLFEPGIEVRHHPDPDKANNHVDNIQIGTRAQNNHDKDDTFNAADVPELREIIRCNLEAGMTFAAMAGVFGKSYRSIANLSLGTTYQHLKGPRRNKDYAYHNPGQSKLSEEEVIEIREMYATGDYTQAELAEEFGVRQTAISRIVRGEVYRYVGGPITR